LDSGVDRVTRTSLRQLRRRLLDSGQWFVVGWSKTSLWAVTAHGTRIGRLVGTPLCISESEQKRWRGAYGARKIQRIPSIDSAYIPNADRRWQSLVATSEHRAAQSKKTTRSASTRRTPIVGPPERPGRKHSEAIQTFGSRWAGFPRYCASGRDSRPGQAVRSILPWACVIGGNSR